jgi:membrane protease YdiL (CAAX protease family)
MDWRFMHWLISMFWNRHERRLRAGWRILIQLICWAVAPALLYWVVGEPISLVVTDLFPDLAEVSERIALSSLTLIAVLFSTWAIVRFVDHRSFADLGLRPDRNWWLDMMFGLILGAVLMTFVFVAEYAAGWVRIGDFFYVGLEDTPFAVAIVRPVIVFVVVGITEEVLSRGYQLRNLAEGMNFPPVGPHGAILIAWLVSSSLFGLLHVANPNSTWISTSYLMLAGIFLGLGFVLTGRLGLPIGLHITWNFFQGSVYGFPVSGNDFVSTSATFVAIEQHGPELWTGGAFGPEAGLIGIVAILLGCLLTIAWVRVRYGAVRLCKSLAFYTPPQAKEPLP